jgi:hypothetical protein
MRKREGKKEGEKERKKENKLSDRPPGGFTEGVFHGIRQG